MDDIVRERLANQCLTTPASSGPGGLVSWMGAVQAQEYEHARWGVGQRLAGASASSVEEDISSGRILRTHVLRPTWHFVVSRDLGWMLALTAPRVHSRMAPYNRHLELDSKTMTRAATVIERALDKGGCLTRAELGVALRRARIGVTPIRLAHIAMHAELEGVICSGPRREGQFTYALTAARISRQPTLDRDDALRELAKRFFQSHGPATIRDFVWWSGLTTPDATRGADIARASTRTVLGLKYLTVESDTTPARRRSGVRVHLLPVYDEYLVAYRDRKAVPHRTSINFKNGRVAGFQHAIVIDGQVAGTWKSDRRGGSFSVTPMRRLSRAERSGLEEASARHARFNAT